MKLKPIIGSVLLTVGVILLISGMYPLWFFIEGRTTSSPSLTYYDNKLFLAIRGGDDNVYYNIWKDDVWVGWSVLPQGVTSDSPAVAYRPDKQSMYFAIKGQTSNIWGASLNVRTWHFSGWSKISEHHATPMLYTYDSTLYIAYEVDDEITINQHQAGEWRNWSTTSKLDRLEYRPAMTFLNDELHLVVRDDGGNIFHGKFSSDRIFSGWNQTLGCSGGSPYLCSLDSTLYLTVKACTSDTIWLRQYTANKWGSWYKYSGATSQGPAITSLGDKLHIVVAGAHVGIYHDVIDTVSPKLEGVWYINGLEIRGDTETAFEETTLYFMFAKVVGVDDSEINCEASWFNGESDTITLDNVEAGIWRGTHQFNVGTYNLTLTATDGESSVIATLNKVQIGEPRMPNLLMTGTGLGSCIAGLGLLIIGRKGLKRA